MKGALKIISKLTSQKRYALVKHIDGDEFICLEDCNGWEEDNTPNLLVKVYGESLNHYYDEILIDDDIVSVEEYNPQK